MVFNNGLPTQLVSMFKSLNDSLFKAIKRVTSNAALIRFYDANKSRRRNTNLKNSSRAFAALSLHGPHTLLVVDTNS